MEIYFDTFGRSGEVLNPSPAPRKIEEYKIINLDGRELPESDQTVREVESKFAPNYDSVSLVSPGMRFMAETDTKLLASWLGDIEGKRILDIGPGTGRVTLPMVEAVGRAGKVYAVDIAYPYLEKIREKAALAGLPPQRLKLATGDVQSLRFEELSAFIDRAPLDYVTIWFGPLALMTTNPQGVLDNCSRLLRESGALMLTTNSLNGLAYRVPEAAIRDGADPKLPLGYEPSIFTRRKFARAGDFEPQGMILGTGQILPATFYDLPDINRRLIRAGLTITDIRGITRLTGLYPRDPSSEFGLELFTGVVSGVEPEVAGKMQQCGNSECVWEEAAGCDEKYCRDADKLPQYTYLAVAAVKS